MLELKNGSSYIDSDESESSTPSQSTRKSRYAYPNKELTNQTFVLLPDTGEFAPYAPQTLRYHFGAVKVYIPGDEASGPRKLRVVCKGRECPVCRELDSQYPHIKDQPYTEKRRHSKMFAIVPVKFLRGRYVVDSRVELMQIEYSYRYDVATRESVNGEWKDLSAAIKSAMDRGLDPFDVNNAIVFERSRGPQGQGARNWRHSVVESESTKQPMTVALPADILAQVTNHYTIEGYARDIGVTDLQRLMTIGREQHEIVTSLAGADSAERDELSESLFTLTTEMVSGLADDNLRGWFDRAIQYATSKANNDERSETEFDRSEAGYGVKTEAKTEAKIEAKIEAKTEAKIEAKIEAKTEAKIEAKTEAKTEAKPAGEQKISAADAVRAKYGLRK